MTKLIIKYKRLAVDESLALIKDTTTNKRNWRHRYVKKVSKVATNQEFKDYPHNKFKTLELFTTFIEDLPKEKRYK